MSWPIAPIAFDANPFQPEWFEQDMFYTPDGFVHRPGHVCKRTFDVSRPFIKRWRVAIDVGCRMGEYTRFLQAHFQETFAFDPNLHPRFSGNLPLDNVTAFQCALGDFVGSTVMYGAQHRVRDTPPSVAAVYRLDDFEIAQVDYIKIDVEGFELKVIRGGLKTIARDRPLIVIEQNDERLADEEPFAAKLFLEDLGYRNVATRKWDYVMAPLEREVLAPA